MGHRRNFSSVYLDTAAMRGHLASLDLILGLSGKLFRPMCEGAAGEECFSMGITEMKVEIGDGIGPGKAQCKGPGRG